MEPITFESLPIPEIVLKGIRDADFKYCTSIQEKTLSLSLSGKDVAGQAQTGTGKTAAFCIPMIEKLMLSDTSTSLILTPTRELAKQILDSIHILLGFLMEFHLSSVFFLHLED